MQALEGLGLLLGDGGEVQVVVDELVDLGLERLDFACLLLVLLLEHDLVVRELLDGALDVPPVHGLEHVVLLPRGGALLVVGLVVGALDVVEGAELPQFPRLLSHLRC